MTQNNAEHPSIPPKPPAFQDNKMYLVARLADDVGPYLGDAPEDRMSTRLIAWKIVSAHAPRTEAEVVQAGRIASLSFTMLDLLNDARNAGLGPALKLKYVAAAVAVNRTICDAERNLERQKRAHPEDGRQVQRAAKPPRDPGIDERIMAMAEAAMAEYQAAGAEADQAPDAGPEPAPDTPDAAAASPGSDAPSAPVAAGAGQQPAATDPASAALAMLEATHAAAAARLEQMKAHYRVAPPAHSKAAQHIQQQQRIVDAALLKLSQVRQLLAAQSGTDACRAAA